MPRPGGLRPAQAAAETPAVERDTWFDMCPGRKGSQIWKGRWRDRQPPCACLEKAMALGERRRDLSTAAATGRLPHELKLPVIRAEASAAELCGDRPTCRWAVLKYCQCPRWRQLFHRHATKSGDQALRPEIFGTGLISRNPIRSFQVEGSSPYRRVQSPDPLFGFGVSHLPCTNGRQLPVGVLDLRA
jgi:hypothetical protein